MCALPCARGAASPRRRRPSPPNPAPMADAAATPHVRAVQEIDPRLVRLRRMRWLAGGLLVLMGVIFLIVSFIPSHWGGLGYVKAFSEAALVGGCADWFAVTALF